MTWEIDPDVVEREKERREDDRATRQQVGSQLSDAGLGDDLRSFLGDSAPAKPVRGPRIGRSLRATFRVVPGDHASGGPGPDPGFPGARAFPLAPHRLNARAAGSNIQPATVWPDGARQAASCSDGLEGRSVAVQPAGTGAAADRPAQSAAAGGDGGRVCGRRAGSVAGSGAKKSAAAGAAAVLPKAIAKLIPKDAQASAVPPRLVPTETERSDARRLFREIGETFNRNRKKSKTAAYAAFRHDLMANLDTLIMGGALDLKEATAIITNLEQYTKETETESTETPATILGRWLRMDAAEVAELEAGAVETEPVEPDEEDSENAEDQSSGQQSI